ncbi:hypothetical protein M2375_003990 [Comamonas sp. BIGb0152]|nr:hypothetical protein [Comamonas sp. BIGb0152]
MHQARHCCLAAPSPCSAHRPGRAVRCAVGPFGGDGGTCCALTGAAPKRQNPSARGAWGVRCLGLQARAMQRCLPTKGCASGSRSSSAGMNRIKFVGFTAAAADSYQSTALWHLSAYAHPGAAWSIAVSGPAAPAPAARMLPQGGPALVLTPVGARHAACNHRGAAAHGCAAPGRRAVRMSI